MLIYYLVQYIRLNPQLLAGLVLRKCNNCYRFRAKRSSLALNSGPCSQSTIGDNKSATLWTLHSPAADLRFPQLVFKELASFQFLLVLVFLNLIFPLSLLFV
jgi:hypothetical protein